MLEHYWPANDYAIGSFIQATVADHYLSQIDIKPTDRVLDIGCGNGAYTRKILDKVPSGSVLGIDASENMLKLAAEVSKEYANFTLEKSDVHTMNYSNQFDYLVSFWCLQWTSDIKKAFINIMEALKPGGKLFTLFPAGDDPFIMSYYALKESGTIAALDQFKAPMEYSQLADLPQKLKNIPCKELKVELSRQSLILPSLDVFRKFVNGIAFYQGQIEEAEIKNINEAMVQYYDEQCQQKYQGEYQFNFTIYLVTGEK